MALLYVWLYYTKSRKLSQLNTDAVTMQLRAACDSTGFCNWQAISEQLVWLHTVFTLVARILHCYISSDEVILLLADWIPIAILHLQYSCITSGVTVA